MYEKRLEDSIYDALQSYMTANKNKVNSLATGLNTLLLIFVSLLCKTCLEADVDFEQFVFHINKLCNKIKTQGITVYKELKGGQ